jgi:hypothetical protein
MSYRLRKENSVDTIINSISDTIGPSGEYLANLIATELSGLSVTTSVTTNISGQTVDISGQTVLLGNELSVDISGQTVDISGQTVLLGNELSVDISGQTVDISGQTVDISGQAVDISGQTVDISGQTVDISGQTVDISGQTVDISGQTVDISGQTVDISGQTVDISGQTVDISGQAVDISGQAVDISGQTVDISGQTVDISGQTVDISGQTVDISGQSVIANTETSILNTVGIAGTSYTGTVESGETYISDIDTNNYPYLMMSFSSDQSGILYFDFTDDESNFDTFPQEGFNINANEHEFHTAIKGIRGFRWRFMNSSASQASIKGYPSYTTIALPNIPVNVNLSYVNEALLVRSITTGEIPTGTYSNEKITGYGLYTTETLNSDASFNGDILDVGSYNQVQAEIFSDKTGVLYGYWYADPSGEILVREYTVPYTDVNNINTTSSTIFSRYVKFAFLNNSGENQTSFYFGAKFLTGSLSSQILGIESFVAPNMVANLQRAITVGKTPTGLYENENIGGYVFRTTESLSGDASYNTDILDLNGYSQIQTEIFADTSGILTGTWYDDASGTNVVRTFNFPYNNSDNLETFGAPIFTRYLRYTYTNSGTDQTRFIFALKLLTKAVSGQFLGVESTITNNMLSNLQRSITVGKQPDGDYVNTPANGMAFTTSSTLGVDNTYTSSWIDSDGWQSIQIVIKSDVQSALDGICIDFTSNTNADTPTTTLTKYFTFSDNDVAQGYKFVNCPTILDGFRIRYINGAVAQSSFELDVSLKVQPESFNYNKAFALLTTDFKTEVALGNISNYSSEIKFGRATSVTANQDIISQGGLYEGHPDNFTPETMDITSSSSADSAAGTGAREIRIIGLKTINSEEFETEDISMNGTSTVTTTNSWYRIHRAYVLQAGSGNQNAGDITIQSSSSSLIFAEIPEGFNNTLQAVYTIPKNNIGLLNKIKLNLYQSSFGNDGIVVSVRIKEPGRPYRAINIYNVPVTGPIVDEFSGGFRLEENTDIVLRVDARTGTGIAATGTFELTLQRIT